MDTENEIEDHNPYEPYDDRVYNSSDFEADEDENEDDSEVPIMPTSSKKKAGRKCQWPETTVTDLVEIILENDKFKTKLLLTNTKNTKNGIYYEQVITELKKRLEEREEVFNFNTKQTRSKFKRCVSLCRKAALTIKTSSGIKRFQEQKDFGPWFEKLFQVVCTMDNCQPEQSIEPHALNKENDDPLDDTELETSLSADDEGSKNTENDSTGNPGGHGKKKRKNNFVPDIKSKKPKHDLDRTMSDISKTLGDLTQALKDSSSNELVNFLKEDAQRQQARDQMFMTLMQTMVTGFPRAQQVPQPQPTPHPYYYSHIPPPPAPQDPQSMARYGNFDGSESSNSGCSSYRADILDSFLQKK